MESLTIEMKDDSPEIKCNAEDGRMEISGKSLPENVSDFYKPVLEWLTQYSFHPQPLTEFTFKLNYFNTSSSKLILDILLILENIHENGKDVIIHWYFPSDDEDMQEAGQEYSDMVNLPFTHHEYTL